MAACVTPVRAISCERAEQQPVLLKPRAKAAAEMESELKPDRSYVSLGEDTHVDRSYVGLGEDTHIDRTQSVRHVCDR